MRKFKDKQEVIVNNPIDRNEQFKNEIALVIGYNWRFFTDSTYKLLFKNPNKQKQNSIGIHEFSEEELKGVYINE